MTALLARESLGPRRREDIAATYPALKAHERIHCEHQLAFSCAVIPGRALNAYSYRTSGRTETNSLNRWVTPTVQLAIVVAIRTALL